MRKDTPPVVLSIVFCVKHMYTNVIVRTIYQGLFGLYSNATFYSILTGWLFDTTKTYDLSFISTGVVLFLAGAILFIIPCIRHGKQESR